MKTQRISKGKTGFTLMELMVAMAITTIIVTVLVSITSIALDTWNRSRAELRASRQAKSMIDSMANDFESLVTRSGNNSEWLSAKIVPSANSSAVLQIINAANLIFFSAVTDRYNGEVVSPAAKGDISCVAYNLEVKNPIGGTAAAGFETFVLNRLVVNPDVTYNNLLNTNDLAAAFIGYQADLESNVNFVCENIVQFTVTFHVEVAQTVPGGTNTTQTYPISVGSSGGPLSVNDFYIRGNEIEAAVTGGPVTSDEIRDGRIKAVEISVTVVSDFGVDQMKRRTFPTPGERAKFLAQNSYQYSKLVQLPTM